MHGVKQLLMSLYCLLATVGNNFVASEICYVLFFKQLREEEQAAELASVTESSPEFSTLDFAISGIIMQNLASSGNITKNIEVCFVIIL